MNSSCPSGTSKQGQNGTGPAGAKTSAPVPFPLRAGELAGAVEIIPPGNQRRQRFDVVARAGALYFCSRTGKVDWVPLGAVLGLARQHRLLRDAAARKTAKGRR